MLPAIFCAFLNKWLRVILLPAASSAWVAQAEQVTSQQQQRVCFIPAIKSVKTFDLFVYYWESEVIFHQGFCLCLHWHFYKHVISGRSFFERRTCGVLWSCGISAMYPVHVSKIVTHIFVLPWFCCNFMTKTCFFVWHFDWQSLFWCSAPCTTFKLLVRILNCLLVFFKFPNHHALLTSNVNILLLYALSTIIPNNVRNQTYLHIYYNCIA